MTHAALRGWADEAKPFRTAELFAFVALSTVALAWFNSEAVMTRDVFHAVLGAQLDASRVDAQYDLVRRWSGVGYIAAPFLLCVQLAVIALLVQLALLLTGTEAAFHSLFRLAICARVPLLLATAARSLWLAQLPAASVTKTALYSVPGSLAWVMLDPSKTETLLYTLLNSVNAAELAWCAIVAYGLTRIARLAAGRAALLTAVVWVSIELFALAGRAVMANGL